eukprot:scaffold137612_cov23-Cyclotella_meneghiniana.AAC.1
MVPHEGPLASSPNALDSPVVVLNTIGAEIDFFHLNALFTPLAGSLQIVAPTTPNSSNTITNVYATGGGVGGIDSAVVAVTITAEAARDGHFTSVGKD